MAQEISLSDLDDYCLHHIFSFLSIMDKVNIAKTCRRFSDIIDHLISNLQLNFNFIYETLTFPIATEIFERYGPKIKKIFMQFDAVEDMVEFYFLVPKNCPNIEEIHYNFPYYVDTEIMEMMFNASKNIKVLHCNARELIDPQIVLISKLSELEMLNIEENRDITGVSLNKLTKLKDLNIRGCSGLEPKHFIGICRATKLKRLDIIECELLDATAFEALVETQTELEHIGISHYYQGGNIDVLAQLKNLQHVHLDYLSHKPDKTTNFLNVLAQHRHHSMLTLKVYRPINLTEADRKSILKLTNLTEIVFIADKNLNDDFLKQLSKSCVKLKRVDLSECSSITNDGVVDLVTNLQDLLYLDLRRCGQFDESLFHKVVEIKSKSQSSKRLTLYMWGTKIKEYELGKLKGYPESKKWVNLSFGFKF